MSTDNDVCDPECDCNAPGKNTRGKVIVCLLVGLAAVAVMTHSIMKDRGSECDPTAGSSCCP